jgi:hypothetical protein
MQQSQVAGRQTWKRNHHSSDPRKAEKLKSKEEGSLVQAIARNFRTLPIAQHNNTNEYSIYLYSHHEP